MAGLLGKIKNDVQKSGGNKSKFFFVREGEKRRIRFLTDMDDGLEVTFHDSYSAGINQPCQEIFRRHCDLCEEEDIRTRSQYVWSIWDYEAKEVKLFMFPVNNCTPIPPLMALFESYGTITDRDYVISVTGKQQNKSYNVVPQDKAKFRNEKAKAYPDKKILDIIDKAYPANDDGKDEDGYEEDEEYEGMSEKELYKLCLERDIEAEKRKPKKYYISLLVENDKAKDDWEDDDDSDDEEDDWAEDDENWDEEDEEVDYSSMTPKELYDLCKEKGIKAKPKQKSDYYIDLLDGGKYAKLEDDDVPF